MINITVGKACELLKLKTYDTAIPQSFFDEMQAMFPNEYFCAVWCYDAFADGSKCFSGYPRPLTQDALYKLMDYNEKFLTRYPVEFETID